MFNLPKYDIIQCDQEYVYSFVSKGINGAYQIFVRFEPSYVKNIYQFEFGPLNPQTNLIDTSFIINNQDTDLIIGTAIYIIDLFLKLNPNGIVRFSGSTASRSRLFCIWIVKNLEELHNLFLIYGCTLNNKWEKFKKNNRYEAILFKSINTYT